MQTDQHKTKLSPKQCKELVKKVSYCLARALDNISWSAYYSNYEKENIKEEKAHIDFKPDGIVSGMTITEGGRFFAVKQIIDYLEGAKAPSIEYYISMRKTVFSAYSLVANYKERILKELEGVNYKEILKINYCFLASHDNKGIELY